MDADSEKVKEFEIELKVTNADIEEEPELREEQRGVVDPSLCQEVLEEEVTVILEVSVRNLGIRRENM